MFNIHQKQIAQFAKANPENMARVITFVYATVQQPLTMVTMIMESIDEQGGSCEYLFGWKLPAFLYVEENQQAIYNIAMNIYDVYPNPKVAEHELLKYFASLPGLGLVKGGFVVQLCFGLSGCLDSHNLERFGYTKQTFAASKFKNAKTEKTRNRLVSKYHTAISKAGGTASLWDSWCDYVANKQPNTYNSGYDVSRLHCEAIGI